MNLTLNADDALLVYDLLLKNSLDNPRYEVTARSLRKEILFALRQVESTSSDNKEIVPVDDEKWHTWFSKEKEKIRKLENGNKDTMTELRSMKKRRSKKNLGGEKVSTPR